MKATNLFLIICIVTTIILSCKRDKLPEPTQEGKNTFGMQVDGKNWLLDNYFSIEGRDGPVVDFFAKQKLLRIYIYKPSTQEVFEFYIEKIDAIGGYKFSKRFNRGLFENDSANTPYRYICSDTTRFERNGACESSFILLDSTNSEINFTRIDTTNQVMSGTFWIILNDNLNNKLEITNGRFDLHYNKN